MKKLLPLLLLCLPIVGCADEYIPVKANSAGVLVFPSNLVIPASSVGAYSVFGNNTNATATGSSLQNGLILGTPGFADTGVGMQLTMTVAGYAQILLQNLSSNAAASADIIVNNNLGTASTHYGDFGINSSGFTGSGSLQLANATYLYSQTGDLVLGTNTSNAIHFVVNNGATDSATISTAGTWQFNTTITAAGNINAGTATSTGTGSGELNVFGVSATNLEGAYMVFYAGASTVIGSLGNQNAIAGGTANNMTLQAANNMTFYIGGATLGMTLTSTLVSTPLNMLVGSGGSASANNTITINGTSTSAFGADIIMQANGTAIGQFGTEAAFAGHSNSNVGIFSQSGSITFYPAQTLAMTLDASQNATFAKNITLGPGGTGTSEAQVTINGGSGTAGGPLIVLESNSSVLGYLGIGQSVTGAATNDIYLRSNSNQIVLQTSGTTALTISTTQAAAFASSVSASGALSSSSSINLSTSGAGVITMTPASSNAYLGNSTNGSSLILRTSISSAQDTNVLTMVGTAATFIGTETVADADLRRTTTTLTSGPTANVPTMTSGPVTGNPTKWAPVNDNGTTRYVPMW